VSNASELLPDPDRPVMTTSALRGSASEMSLRLCSRAPEITIWSPPPIRSLFYDCEQMFAQGLGPVGARVGVGASSVFDRRVHLVDQRLTLGELEVLRQVALCGRARLAAESHVQGHQPRPVEIAVVGRRSALRARR